MKIGTVAQSLNIPASTLRYYEKVGLIDHQRRVSGRREFDSDALQALKFIQLAQAAGFSINEIKSLLKSYDQDPSPAGMWHPFAISKQKTIRKQIDDLKNMDRVLSKLLACECRTLGECVESSCKMGSKGQVLDD